MSRKPPTDDDDIVFKKAARESEFTLTAMAGATGSGKTKSALRYATGLVDGSGKRIAFGDTENGRGLHYAPPPGREPQGPDEFDFDHFPIQPPYTPERFLAIVLKAEKLGYGALIFDSFSHEYAGEGGISEQQEEEVLRLCTDEQTGKFDAWKADKVGPAAWKIPKRAHKKMMFRLINRKMHIIFCLRAEEKIEFQKEKYTKSGGAVGEKTIIVQKGFQPICEKSFMFEVTLSMMFMPPSHGTPGIPTFIKIEGQHKVGFEGARVIDEDSGRFIRDWAKGGATPKKSSTTKSVEKQEKPAEREEKKPEPAKSSTGKYVLFDTKGKERRTDDVAQWGDAAVAVIAKADEIQIVDFARNNEDQLKALEEEGRMLTAKRIRDAIKERRAAFKS